MNGRIIPIGTPELVSLLQKIMLSAMLALCLVLAPGVVADELSDQRDERARELQQLRDAISVSEDRRKELAAQIESLDKDRETINRSLIETTQKSRKLEKRASRAEERLSRLRDEQDGIRTSLNSKRGLLAEVLGALLRMGQKPPPALLVTPEDALSSVRSSILLGSVVPEIRGETEILIGELRNLVQIANDITAQRDSLSNDLAALAEEEERLNLLMAQKQELAGSVATNLAQESAKAAELAAKATSLQDLVASLEREIAAVREAAEAARIADEERRQREANRIEAARNFEGSDVFSDAGRLSPAIAFTAAKGLLPVPVEGFQLTRFGQRDEFGEASSGINLETRPGARVISPNDGWIVYAGPFRTYGQLLIINAGEGYHVVLAGMAELNVKPGQFVIVGEPLGRMGAHRLAAVGQLDVSTTKPILYVEFRKDDTPVDPAPWWSANSLEKETNGS